MSDRAAAPFSMDGGYPRFSPAEMARRRVALEGLLARHGLNHALLYGANRAGPAVQWLTGWPATAEAAAILTPGRPVALFVQYHNHVPLARRLAPRSPSAAVPRRSITRSPPTTPAPTRSARCSAATRERSRGPARRRPAPGYPPARRKATSP